MALSDTQMHQTRRQGGGLWAALGAANLSAWRLISTEQSQQQQVVHLGCCSLGLLLRSRVLVLVLLLVAARCVQGLPSPPPASGAGMCKHTPMSATPGSDHCSCCRVLS